MLVPTKAPLPPQRHPRRALRVKTTATPAGIGITNDQIDVWDRAAQLYQYSIQDEHWQMAAEDFTMLAGNIESNTESTLCLLNTAIIFSRLGVYAAVSRVMDRAQPAGPLVALTMFIVAYVELQRGNYGKAEDCFKVTLEGLGKSSHDYKSLGLDFTLNVADVRYNLFILRTTKQNRHEILETLGQLPIKSIFRAPAKSEVTTTLPIKTRSPTIGSQVSTIPGSEATPSLYNGSSQPSSPVSPVGEGFFDTWLGEAWASSSRSLSIVSAESNSRRWSNCFEEEKDSSIPVSIMSSGYNPYSPTDVAPDPASLKAKVTDQHPSSSTQDTCHFEPSDARMQPWTTQGISDSSHDPPSSEIPELPSRSPQRTGLEPLFENTTIPDDTISALPSPSPIHSRHDNTYSKSTETHPALRSIPEQEPAETPPHLRTIRIDHATSRPIINRSTSTASTKSGKSTVSKLSSITPSLNNFHYTWRGGLQYENLDNPKPPKIRAPPGSSSGASSKSYFGHWGNQMGSLWDKGAMDSVGTMVRQGNMRSMSVVRRGSSKRIDSTGAK